MQGLLIVGCVFRLLPALQSKDGGCAISGGQVLRAESVLGWLSHELVEGGTRSVVWG